LKFEELFFDSYFVIQITRTARNANIHYGPDSQNPTRQSSWHSHFVKEPTSNVRDKRLAWELPLLINVGFYIYCSLLKIAF